MFKTSMIGGNVVLAENLETGSVETFTIRETDCELNGVRRYLVHDAENLRVRIYRDTQEAIASAVEEYAEKRNKGTLHSHQ